jgi:hypothetical protein
MFIVTAIPSIRSSSVGAAWPAIPHHAAPLGLETVLCGLGYYKHVAPTELPATASTPPTAAGAGRWQRIEWATGSAHAKLNSWRRFVGLSHVQSPSHAPASFMY